MSKKLSRQLIIFFIFSCSNVVEINEIVRLLKVSKKTIIRDVKDLNRMGIINVRHSRKEKGYIHLDDNSRCPFSGPVFTSNKAVNTYTKKAVRLAFLMVVLRKYTDSCESNQLTCVDCYKDNFPDLCVRTMYRDFSDLGKIGFRIFYDQYEKKYDIYFPDEIEDLLLVEGDALS